MRSSAVLLVVIGLLSACGPKKVKPEAEDRDTRDAAVAGDDDTDAPKPENPAKLGSEPMVDAQIATVLEIACDSEIDVAKLVLARSSNASVKAHARQVIADQSRLSSSVHAWMGRWKVAPTASNTRGEIEERTKETVEAYTLLNSPRIDERYIAARAEEHGATIEMIEALAAQATHPELRAILGEARPKLALHLVEATRLLPEVKAASVELTLPAEPLGIQVKDGGPDKDEPEKGKSKEAKDDEAEAAPTP